MEEKIQFLLAFLISATDFDFRDLHASELFIVLHLLKYIFCFFYLVASATGSNKSSISNQNLDVNLLGFCEVPDKFWFQWFQLTNFSSKKFIMFDHFIFSRANLNMIY